LIAEDRLDESVQRAEQAIIGHLASILAQFSCGESAAFSRIV
jgi:hypothetical protein